MTTPEPDPYAVLGVPPDATQAQISHAYRSLLRRHHPDTRPPSHQASGGVSDSLSDEVSDEVLRRLLAAYAVLHDPTRRADYDREAGARQRRTARRPSPTPSDTAAHRPPIVAGPVRWHPPADPA